MQEFLTKWLQWYPHQAFISASILINSSQLHTALDKPTYQVSMWSHIFRLLIQLPRSSEHQEPGWLMEKVGPGAKDKHSEQRQPDDRVHQQKRQGKDDELVQHLGEAEKRASMSVVGPRSVQNRGRKAGLQTNYQEYGDSLYPETSPSEVFQPVFLASVPLHFLDWLKIFDKMCFWLSISIFWPWDISAFQIIQTGRDLIVNLSGRMFVRSLHQQQTFLLAPHRALWDLKMLRPGSKGCSGDRNDKAESRSDWSTHKGCSIFSPSCANPLCIVTVLVEMMCLAGRQRCRKETFLSSAIYSTIWGTVVINLYPSSNFSAAKEERSLGAMQFPGCNKYVPIYHTSLLQNFKFSFRLCPGESLCRMSHSHPQTLLSFSLFLSILVSMDQTVCCVFSTRYLPVLAAHPFLQVPVWTWSLSSQFSHLFLHLRG